MKNQPAMQGSASVLIILVMLSLTAFGVLAMVSAYSDVKLARKNAEFTAQYYALDALGEEAYAAACAAYRAGAPESLTGLGWTHATDTDTFTRDLQHDHLYLTIGLHPSDGGLIIVSWKEWQQPFAYDDALGDVWDGETVMY